jgi:hypothetical protein
LSVPSPLIGAIPERQTNKNATQRNPECLLEKRPFARRLPPPTGSTPPGRRLTVSACFHDVLIDDLYYWAEKCNRTFSVKKESDTDPALIIVATGVIMKKDPDHVKEDYSFKAIL